MNYKNVGLIFFLVTFLSSCGIVSGIKHASMDRDGKCENAEIKDKNISIAVIPNSYNFNSINHALRIEKSLMKLGAKVIDPPKLRPSLVKKTELNKGTQGQLKDISTELSFKYSDTEAEYFIKTDYPTDTVKLIKKDSNMVVSLSEYSNIQKYDNFKNLYWMLTNAGYPVVSANGDKQLEQIYNKLHCLAEHPIRNNPTFTVYRIQNDTRSKEFKNIIEKSVLKLGLNLVESPKIKEITLSQGLSLIDSKKENRGLIGRAAEEIVAEKYLVFEETDANYIIKPYIDSSTIKIIEANSGQVLSISRVHRYRLERASGKLRKILNSGGFRISEDKKSF